MRSEVGGQGSGVRLTDLTGLPGVAVGTGAVVLVRLRVHAGSSVPAGSVGPAVVQIWKQQLPAKNNPESSAGGGGGSDATLEDCGKRSPAG